MIHLRHKIRNNNKRAKKVMGETFEEIRNMV